VILLAVFGRALDNRLTMEDSDCAYSNGPLHGVRVLDLSRVMAGPWSTQLLADYGAEVIKVERPGGGDDTRSWGPPWLGKNQDTADAAYFLSANRNKRSVTVNLANADGRAIIRRLADQSDVIVENFKVGTMHRFGLDYASLSKNHPELVYCSISAYGQTGSRADRPGYDAMIQASGGLMSITGESDEEGGSPQKVGIAVADIMAGMYAASAILAALLARKENERGQHIDIPLYDVQVAMLANQSMNYLIGDLVPTRMGSAHPNIAPYQTFRTSDGHLSLAVGSNRQFEACLHCLDLGELVADEKYKSNAGRVENRQELTVLMAQRFRLQPTAHWLQTLSNSNVPAGPVNSIADVFEEDYAKERELVRQIRHDEAGEIPTVANPVRFSKTQVEYRLAPPRLGQHTREILSAELGYSEQEIESLAKAGAI